MIMILTLLPAESDAAKKLADLTADGNVLAVAASKISDFGNDSLSGDSGKKDGQDAKEDESSQPEEEESSAEGKIEGIVLTDYTSEGSASDKSVSEGAVSGVSTAANKASDIAGTAVQQAGGGGIHRHGIGAAVHTVQQRGAQCSQTNAPHPRQQQTWLQLDGGGQRRQRHLPA